MKTRTVKTAENKHQLGAANNNKMAHQNGLDEIDLWAISLGKCERSLSSLTPNRKYLQTINS